MRPLPQIVEFRTVGNTVCACSARAPRSPLSTLILTSDVLRLGCVKVLSLLLCFLPCLLSFFLRRPLYVSGEVLGGLRAVYRGVGGKIRGSEGLDMEPLSSAHRLTMSICSSFFPAAAASPSLTGGSAPLQGVTGRWVSLKTSILFV